MNEKITARSKRFIETDKIYKEKVKSGLMDKDKYLAWKERQLNSTWAKEMYATLEKDLIKTNEIAKAMIDEETWEAYARGYNMGLYEIEKGIKATTSFQLYNKRSVERLLVSNPALLPEVGVSRWGTKRLRNAVTQSILQGESIDQLSKRLTRVVGMEGASAVRNARTIMNSAQNGGRQKVAEDAQEMGINLKKVWLATLDERTRDSHAEMDGVEVDVDEPFDVNGSDLMFPADPNGDPSEVYNCRCTMIYNVDGDISSVNPDDIDRHGSIGSYDKWKSRR